MARKGRRLTDAERAERRRRERERLELATAELLTSAGWRRWLRGRSVLRGYSLQNTLLIAQQCHARGIEPTYVAGFRAWLRLGRAVSKGQKGLQIWAPMRIKVRDAHGEEREEQAQIPRGDGIRHVISGLPGSPCRRRRRPLCQRGGGGSLQVAESAEAAP